MRGRAEAVAEAVPRGERSCPTQCRGAEAAARWSAEAAARRPRVTGRPRALSLARRRNECTYVRRARRAGPSHHRPSTIPRAGSIVGHPPHHARARGTLITLPRPMLREGEGSNGAPRVVRGRARRTARTLTESAPPSRSRRRRDLSSLLSPCLVPRARDRPPLVKNRPRRHDPFLPPPLRVWFVLARRCGSR